MDENFPKVMLDLLFLKKSVFVLSHLNSSLTLQMQNGRNQDQGVEIRGLYACMKEKGRPKVTQILIRKSKVQ